MIGETNLARLKGRCVHIEGERSKREGERVLHLGRSEGVWKDDVRGAH